MAHDQITYRTLIAVDLPAIAELFEAHTGRPADLDVLGSWIDTFPSAAAHDNGALVGFLVTCRFAPDVLEIANLHVGPSHRRRGVARRLLGTVAEPASRMGYRAAIVASSTLNVSLERRVDARSFYESLGFGVVFETPSTSILAMSLETG